MKLFKIILPLLLLLALSGCVTKYVPYPVYIECDYPRIELVSKVPLIEVTPADECVVTDDSVMNLINGSRRLRRSEEYYIKEITRYNIKFVDNDN